MKTLLTKIFQNQFLSRAEASSALIDIANERFHPLEVAAFLSAFNMRNIHIDELKGFRDAMLQLCVPLNLEAYKCIDVCGTGGDGKNTFNISTLSAFVIAGAGIPVAKHGNYGVSSVSGSSNVLEHLGISFSKDEEGLKKQLDNAGICFIHAPFFHPGMKAVAPIRKQLGVKTFFNMLGPLSNPSKPQYQMVGLFNLDLLRMYQYLFQDEGIQFSLVHSMGGYDEVSLTSDFKCVQNTGDFYYSKDTFSQQAITEMDLYGGETVADAAAIFMNILHQKGTSAQNNVVLINSAIAIQTYRPQLSITEALDIASDSLFNAKALLSFQNLKKLQ